MTESAARKDIEKDAVSLPRYSAARGYRLTIRDQDRLRRRPETSAAR